MSNWKDVKVGSPITGITAHGSNTVDNFRVEALGYDWAVLRHKDASLLCPAILEPDDDFIIGEHIYDEDGSMILVEG
jgi:hypothetical protein